MPVLLVACAAWLAACPSPTAVPLPRLSVATATLPDAVRAQPYSEAIHAEGGDGAYWWELAAGTLPPGLALSVDDLGVDHALITGTPDEVGTWTFTLRLRSGDGQVSTRQYTITVVPEPDPLAIHIRRLPPAVAGGPFAVQLRANGGDEASYRWRVVAGALPAGLVLTETGRIEGTPASPGGATFTVEVRSGDMSTQWTYTLRVVAADAAAFRITLFPVVDIPAAVQPHVDAAVARWERAIVGNLQPITIPTAFFGPSGCGGFGPWANGTSVDDVLIMINITPIDGPGGVLGQAGPCAVRQGSTLPFAGIVTLDAADVVPLAGTETLTDLIAHEIAHVLGFGTLWEAMGLLTGAGTADPRFTGPRAVAEYQALGGTADVPVEAQGGEGTRDGHWRKSVFGIELMTGFAEPVGIAQPASRVTLAQWQDMGYAVNLQAAEPFVLRTAAMHAEALRDAGIAPIGHDVLYDGPILVLHPDGSSSRLGGRR
jgi:hypothetical protein